PQHLTAELVALLGDGFDMRLDDPSEEPYEVTAIRVSIGGEPTWAAMHGPWPRLEPDGTLTVPTRPIAGQPLSIHGGWSHRPPSFELKVTVDIASRLAPGYRTSRTLDLFST
ncbi:MAG: hypothetical protein ACRD0P_24385, partial [Stackebrandtia sp.]